MKKNIVLIGFMGSGKSTVGRLLARKLNYDFVDTDALIEARTKQQIKDIFEKMGEPAFRQIEAKVVAEVAKSEGKVIACGGGVILNSKNIQALQKNGLIVYLKAEPEVLYSRVKKSEIRPLLNVPDPETRFYEIFSERRLRYEKAADLIIDITELKPSEIAKKVVENLEHGKIRPNRRCFSGASQL